MGCWNHSDAITQMPILYNEPVRGIFIIGQRNPTTEGTCYSSDIYSPCFLPIKGRYDDYGGIKNVERDWNVEYIERWFQTHAVEMPVGENRFHDRAVVRENLDINGALTAIKDNRLFIPGLWFGDGTPKSRTPAPVSFVMIHEDIWQEIITTPIDTWQGPLTTDTKATELRLQLYKDLESKDQLYAAIADSKANGTKIDYSKIGSMLSENTVRDVLRGVAQFPATSLTMYFENEKHQPDLPERAAELIMASVVMEHLRRIWFPLTGLGSQDNNEDTIRRFHKAVERVFDKRDEDLY